MEVFVRRISEDPIGFRFCWCGFRYGSSDLRISSLTTVAALERWSFVALMRRLPVCLVQQVLLRHAFPGSDDGEARTTTRLRLVPMSIVVSRWSKDLSVIFITF